MMKVAFVWCLVTLGGAAGFMCNPHLQRASPHRCPPIAAQRLGTRAGLSAATGRGCVTESTLRMGGDVQADGGGSDGAALAEARIVVHGQSTGGYFRAHARNEAHFNRKLCGALKELGEGRTEIIVEGKTSAIRSFLRWCKRGPGLSQRIQDVTVDWAEYTGIFDGFEIFPEPGASNNKKPGVP